MILVRSPNRWSCLASSFAMALGVTLEEIIKMVGHDGSEVVWPDFQEPNRRRGFHPQEMVYAASILNFSVTPFEAFPTSVGRRGAKPFVVPMTIPAEQRMRLIMTSEVGVLTGETRRAGGHAVAWDGQTILDPGLPGSEFHLDTFWLVRKIKS